MDDLQKTQHKIRYLLFGLILVENIILAGVFYVLSTRYAFRPSLVIEIALGLGLVLSLLIAISLSSFVIEPLAALRSLIINLGPNETGKAPLVRTHLNLGQELYTSLSAQLYQIVTVSSSAATQNHLKELDLHNNFVAANLPIPLIVIDNKQNIKFVNEAVAQYIGIASEDMIGKNVYMVIDMSFPSNDTFDNWLKDVKLKYATAVRSWERVRLNVRDSHPVRLFDLAAYYNRENINGNETILILFDHTKMYSQDDQAVSFMALSVHELRTPLTLLRGYIEVFEDEIAPSLDEEQKGFMQKMHAQAEQLTDYVNNILNVARVDDDQLVLQLQADDWPTILKRAIEAISLRAKVRGITINCTIAKNLPKVAVDGLSIQEVINNLIDNAIKYSGTSKVINISSYVNKTGQVETAVQDFGNGIPASVMANLFTKFYRDYRNRAQIGGTGLGLYLSKAIVTAHNGNIWVRSQEGKGSTFGFTLVPYDNLATTQKSSGDQSITRSAHGWIKNHSMYRR